MSSDLIDQMPTGRKKKSDKSQNSGRKRQSVHKGDAPSRTPPHFFRRLVGAGLALPPFHTIEELRGQGKPSPYELFAAPPRCTPIPEILRGVQRFCATDPARARAWPGRPWHSGSWCARHVSCWSVVNVATVPMLRTAEEAERRYLRATPLRPRTVTGSSTTFSRSLGSVAYIPNASCSTHQVRSFGVRQLAAAFSAASLLAAALLHSHLRDGRWMRIGKPASKLAG